MSNTFFQFKEFLIHQDKAAMKVCTDSCLFAAWVAHYAQPHPDAILDIGSGTGLLSLMLAQRFQETEIHALEIEPNAILQTQENFQNSIFNKRLHLFPNSLQEYSINSDRKYDIIICNPPFFTSHLLSHLDKNNLAKHNKTLPPSELCFAVTQLMKQESEFWLLIPASESIEHISCFENNGLFLNDTVEIFHNDTKPSFRLILKFSYLAKKCSSNTQVIIRNLDGTYTDKFIGLLKNYYLNL